MTELAIVNCRQLVTLAGPARARTGSEMRELAVIPDGALAARDGRILKVGTRAEIERELSSDAEIVDAGGRIVLPGFVDAHTHPVFAGNRKHADQKPRHDIDSGDQNACHRVTLGKPRSAVHRAV